MNGKGRWIYPDDTVFEGQFLDNLPIGEGVFLFPNGNALTGRYEQSGGQPPNAEPATAPEDPLKHPVKIELRWIPGEYTMRVIQQQ